MTKNPTQVQTLFALRNLLMVRRKRKAVAAGARPKRPTGLISQAVNPAVGFAGEPEQQTPPPIARDR